MTEPSPWDVERLDLEAYLARVGVPASAPSREALDALHEAHVRAFTFDNIDVLLDQHPGVRLDASRRDPGDVDRAAPGDPTEHGVLRGGELADLLDELAVPLTLDERAGLLVRVTGLPSAR